MTDAAVVTRGDGRRTERCLSSVVEHSIRNRKVGSSILPCSFPFILSTTTLFGGLSIFFLACFGNLFWRAHVFPPRGDCCQTKDQQQKCRKEDRHSPCTRMTSNIKEKQPHLDLHVVIIVQFLFQGTPSTGQHTDDISMTMIQ